MNVPYESHDTVPAYEFAVWTEDKKECLNRDRPLLWSKDIPPPEIGTEIVSTINSIGPGVVVGYFTQDGWLGLRVQHHNPPEWYVKQNGGNVQGHVFGPEFRLP